MKDIVQDDRFIFLQGSPRSEKSTITRFESRNVGQTGSSVLSMLYEEETILLLLIVNKTDLLIVNKILACS